MVNLNVQHITVGSVCMKFRGARLIFPTALAVILTKLACKAIIAGLKSNQLYLQHKPGFVVPHVLKSNTARSELSAIWNTSLFY